MCDNEGLPTRNPQSRVMVVVVDTNDGCVAVGMDDMREEADLLVRPLPPPFNGMPWPGVVGAALTAEGHPMAALDLEALIGGLGESRLPAPPDAVDDSPLRVLVDGRLRVPLSKAFFQVGPALVATCAAATARDRYLAEGHELLAVPGSNGHVDLRKLLLELAARGVNEVLVEAGPRLAGAFARAGLVDEYRIFMAPKLLGSSARPLLELPLNRMAEAPQLKILDIRAVGDDWQVTAVPERQP